MLIKDSFVIHAPLGTVWEMLEDIPRIAPCVPGVSSLEQIGPDTYQGLLEVKVGPIGAAFNGQVTFIERVPTERIVAKVEGQDARSATLVTATFTAVLAAAEGNTQLAYEIDVALRGRLAQFGVAVVQATAKKLASLFAKCLESELDQSPSQAKPME